MKEAGGGRKHSQDCRLIHSHAPATADYLPCGSQSLEAMGLNQSRALVLGKDVSLILMRMRCNFKTANEHQDADVDSHPDKRGFVSVAIIVSNLFNSCESDCAVKFTKKYFLQNNILMEFRTDFCPHSTFSPPSHSPLDTHFNRSGFVLTFVQKKTTTTF